MGLKTCSILSPEIPDSKIFLSGPANIPHALYEVKSAWWEWTPVCLSTFWASKSYKHMHVWQVLQNPIGQQQTPSNTSTTASEAVRQEAFTIELIDITRES